jgi:hypothetical protein
MSNRGKDWIKKDSWIVDFLKSETKSQSLPFQQISKTSGLKFSFLGETNAAGVNNNEKISFLFSVLLTKPSAGQVINTNHYRTFHAELRDPKKLMCSSYPASR